jgi:thioredoxin 1
MKFNDAIKSAPVVLVEFYASWCPHCQAMISTVDDVRETLAGRVPVHQFDIDVYTTEADEYDVETVPCFIIFRNGEEIWRKTGEMEGHDLLNRVEKYL